MEPGAFSVGLILDASVNIGMADGVGGIVAEEAGHIGNGLFPLLLGTDGGDLVETVPEETVHMVFVHMGTDVPVVPVAQDRDIIKEDIRALEPDLVEPAVFGDHML